MRSKSGSYEAIFDLKDVPAASSGYLVRQEDNCIMSPRSNNKHEDDRVKLEYCLPEAPREMR